METATVAENRALLVDPDESARAALQRLLRRQGYACDHAAGLDEALAALAPAPPIVLAAADAGGARLIEALRACSPAVAIILVGGRRCDAALAAFRSGADDYLTRPVRARPLALALERAGHAYQDRAARQAHERAQAALIAQMQGGHAALIQNASFNALSRMAANLAHEINNPLTPILGMAELIREELPGDPTVQGYAQAISASAQRIRDIVRSMLDFARPSMQQRVPFDMGALLRTTLLLEEQRLRDHAVQIALALPDQPLIVIASAAQIKHALLILIDNAREAMPRGGTLRIALEADPASGSALVAISDSGVGIAPQHMPYIFDPFYSTKPQVAGVGLGLAVAASIIQSHGGAIAVETAEGQGSTFQVRLPLGQLCYEL